MTPDIIGVKSEVTKINKMVAELYDRPVIPKLEVITVMPDIFIDNIWAIPDPVEETRPVVDKTKRK